MTNKVASVFYDRHELLLSGSKHGSVDFRTVLHLLRDECYVEVVSDERPLDVYVRTKVQSAKYITAVIVAMEENTTAPSFKSSRRVNAPLLTEQVTVVNLVNLFYGLPA